LFGLKALFIQIDSQFQGIINRAPGMGGYQIWYKKLFFVVAVI
jgi:hypothetical protein